MKTKNVNNAIEDWLGGRADRAGREWLAGEMNKDPELAREVNLRRKTDEIIADRQVMELRSKLSAIGRKKRSAIPLRGIIIKSAKYAAAVAIIAVISTALYLELRPGASAEQLYASNYDHFESPGAVRSASGAGNTLMENAIASYSAKEYEKAIMYLEQIINSDRNDMESVFMHGMANMEVKNYPVASGSFTRVIEHNDNLYLEDAEWYLGLCYMMTGNREKAMSQFSSIASSESRYSRKAARLSRKLK
ncbi:MAG: tol-pal system YbgF family protein [Bacteroidales bacterium]